LRPRFFTKSPPDLRPSEVTKAESSVAIREIAGASGVLAPLAGGIEAQIKNENAIPKTVNRGGFKIRT
jgi:hypothetical protein